MTKRGWTTNKMRGKIDFNVSVTVTFCKIVSTVLLWDWNTQKSNDYLALVTYHIASFTKKVAVLTCNKRDTNISNAIVKTFPQKFLNYWVSFKAVSCLSYDPLRIIQICSQITRGRVLSGELYAQRLQKLIYLRLFTNSFMKISPVRRLKRNLHETVHMNLMSAIQQTFYCVLNKSKHKVTTKKEHQVFNKTTATDE